MFLRILIFGTLSLLSSCASAPQEMSQTQLEICKEIDFDLEPSMRELCGNRKMRFQGYKNIPNQRFLINPKNSYLIEVDSSVELRLPKTRPINLGPELLDKISFTKQARLESLKNKYFYLEKFLDTGERIKIFKLRIPTNSGETVDYCFTIPDNSKRDRRRSLDINIVEQTSCSYYDHLTKK